MELCGKLVVFPSMLYNQFDNNLSISSEQKIPAQRTNMLCRIQTTRNMATGKKVGQSDAFTWRSFTVVSVVGLGAMYYLKILKEEKDKGNLQSLYVFYP